MSILVSTLVWRLPIRIMKYGVNYLNLGWPVAPERSSRRRPLHTCGTSLVSVARKSCTKLQDLDGPLGLTATRAFSIINMFAPLIYIILYPILAIISHIDDRILAFETKAESIFPPSARLFDKIDVLVSSSETLPEHVNDAFQRIPLLMNRIPFLHRMISWLNYVLSILTRSGASEKETTVDVAGQLEELVHSCSDRRINNHMESRARTFEVVHKSVDRLCFLRNRIVEPQFVDSPMYSSYQSANSSPASDYTDGEAGPFNHLMNYSYKEILMEKGHKEKEEEKAETAGKNSNEGTTTVDHSNEKSKLT